MPEGVLRGERLAIEPLRPEHAERLLSLRRTADVELWWDPAPDGWPLAPEHGLSKFAITQDGEVAGFIQFWEEPDPMPATRTSTYSWDPTTRVAASARRPWPSSCGT